MLIVDANILAYLVIEGERSNQARALLQKDYDWHSEAFIFVELTNILATSLRLERVNFEYCRMVLERAEAFMGSTVHLTSHLEVIRTAHEFRISAYDARYIALAREFGTPLITEDAKLRRAVPRLTISLNDALEQ
ncbi:MAG TPA: type II toxin-antitoxin system VapC family toxin [Candidatus Kapabacteria bacterium]|nr:type II toxin-antitoxin system VapC family toxin [Candidatus Kapabacteria bacterium]